MWANIMNNELNFKPDHMHVYIDGELCLRPIAESYHDQQHFTSRNIPVLYDGEMLIERIGDHPLIVKVSS